MTDHYVRATRGVLSEPHGLCAPEKAYADIYAAPIRFRHRQTPAHSAGARRVPGSAWFNRHGDHHSWRAIKDGLALYGQTVCCAIRFNPA